MTRRYPDFSRPIPRYTWGEIFSVVLGCIVTLSNFLLLLLLFVAAIKPAHATWKPEYGKAPQAVQEWFRSQLIMPAAAIRLGYSPGVTNCCDHADRLFTKFVGFGGSDWRYYTDPDCTHSGCELKPIPDDTIHPEGIHALDPKDDGLPEFDAMRREGVLMIYAGAVMCFWPPESST